jgi:hypothetical protein
MGQGRWYHRLCWMTALDPSQMLDGVSPILKSRRSSTAAGSCLAPIAVVPGRRGVSRMQTFGPARAVAAHLSVVVWPDVLGRYETIDSALGLDQPDRPVATQC